MSRLAKEYGVSDRGLAKLCARHNIPVPPRGYWAKKQAGRKVKEIALPESNAKSEDTIRLPSSAHQSEELKDLKENQRKQQDVAKQTEQALEIPVNSPHKHINSLAQKVRKQKAEFISAGQLRGANVLSISVSKSQSERLIAVLDRIVRFGEARGLKFEFTPEGARVQHEGNSISISAGELHRTVPHELTEKESKAMEKWRASREKRSRHAPSWDDYYSRPQIPEHDQIYSGRLFFRVDNYEPSLRKSWQEGKVQRLENLCGGIVDTIEAHFLANRLRAEKAEKDRRDREFLQHRRNLSEQRKKREHDRACFLGTVISQGEEAGRIRDFLSKYDIEEAEPETARFFRWAKVRLDQIEQDLSPLGMAANLKDAALFPGLPPK